MYAFYLTTDVDPESWAAPVRCVEPDLEVTKLVDGLYFVCSSLSEKQLLGFAGQTHHNPSRLSCRRAELPIPEGTPQSVAEAVRLRLLERDQEEAGFSARQR